MSDLKVVAELLETTMTNAGILDDYDELIWDILEDNSLDEARKYHESVLAGVAFIKEHTDDTYLDAESLTATFEDVLEEKGYTW